MANAWIEHVKRYAKDHNPKYNEALKKAKSTYTKSTSTKKRVSRKKKH